MRRGVFASRSRLKPACSVILNISFWLVVALALWWPVDLALRLNANGSEGFASAAGIFALVALSAAVIGQSGKRIGLFLVIPLILLLILVRSGYYGLIQFSGSGFNDEFFIHFGWDSIQVAWQEYDRVMRRVFGAMLLLGIALFALGRKLAVPGRRLTALLVVVGGMLVLSYRNSLPEWQLWSAWRTWATPPQIAIDDQRLRQWEALGLIATAFHRKQRIGRINALFPEFQQYPHQRQACV